jgi:hypothetical protein
MLRSAEAQSRKGTEAAHWRKGEEGGGGSRDAPGVMWKGALLHNSHVPGGEAWKYNHKFPIATCNFHVQLPRAEEKIFCRKRCRW